jgi:hypothetical protein
MNTFEIYIYIIIIISCFTFLRSVINAHLIHFGACLNVNGFYEGYS